MIARSFIPIFLDRRFVLFGTRVFVFIIISPSEILKSGEFIWYVVQFFFFSESAFPFMKYVDVAALQWSPTFAANAMRFLKSNIISHHLRKRNLMFFDAIDVFKIERKPLAYLLIKYSSDSGLIGFDETRRRKSEFLDVFPFLS